MQGAPAPIAASGFWHLAAGDHHVRAGGKRDLGRLELGPHAALRQLGPGVARHRLDLRRDGGDDVEALGRARAARGCGVEAVDVGEQHEAVGRHHGGDARRQAVVVAVADLRRRHGVVLVDDRDRLQVEQRLDGMARVEVAAPLLGVAERQQDLRGEEAAGARELLVGMREADLADGGGGLALLQLQRALGQFQRVAPERDGAGGHDDELLAGRGEHGDVVHQRGQPLRLQRPGRAVGEKRRADLDDDAPRLGPLRARADAGNGGIDGGFGVRAHVVWVRARAWVFSTS